MPGDRLKLPRVAIKANEQVVFVTAIYQDVIRSLDDDDQIEYIIDMYKQMFMKVPDARMYLELFNKYVQLVDSDNAPVNDFQAYPKRIGF